MKYAQSIVLIIFTLLFSQCNTLSNISSTKSHNQDSTSVKPNVVVQKPRTVEESVAQFLQSQLVKNEFSNLTSLLKPTSILVDSSSKSIQVHFNRYFSYIPFREENTSQFYKEFQSLLPDSLVNWNFSLNTMKKPLEELIPNAYRSIVQKDLSRKPTVENSLKPLVRQADNPFDISNGLSGRHIAMWHSHGWYYNYKEDRWMWQRARLFGTVEDLYPMSIVVPYLVPMLERAGANTFLPRERDIQTNEIIVDNNGSDYKSKYVENGTWRNGKTKGFAIGKRPYKGNVNPFVQGSTREIIGNLKGSSQIGWIPEIPESGYYAVYVSYDSSPENTTDAEYKVYHSGGETTFYVNQQIGGSTWVYLGTFHFNEGLDSKNQKVVLTNKVMKDGARVSGDAVRFGGGMGVIERNGRVSDRPKFVEGSRYWLQYAGFPDTLIYDLNKENDYNDDYQSRGEWVNYLVGAPYGPNKKRDEKGLGIPVDISLAFHTDAGITGNDDIIGTLMIYSVEDYDSSLVFPNGMSRFANRDLGDLMQTQIVDDIRYHFDSTWTRRNLYNRQYSEAFRANVPSVLLELLSHQNFADVKFGHNPKYKFEVARAIYKSMLKFLAEQHQFEYVVLPLPVTHMSVQLTDKGNFKVNWQPQTDPLESTATADAYMVYVREGENGFDNGTLVEDVTYEFEKPKKNVIYSFKVEAVNKGGRSMSSEIVSAGLGNKGKSPVLVINGFNRLSGPSSISVGNFEGFLFDIDRGVYEGNDISYVGEQFNYDKSSRWGTDDEPGHGASYANYETSVIAGNTFDFGLVHGKSILEAGYSFFSSSSDAVMDNHIDITSFKYVDLILGEQKKTRRYKQGYKLNEDIEFETFPEKLQSKIKFYAQSGGNLFISGAYITTDSYRNFLPDSNGVQLLEETLHVKHRTDHASKTGEVVATSPSEFKLPKSLFFNTKLSSSIYQVESPDAIHPSTEDAKIIARYKENGFSAAVAFEGYYKTVVFGFPFETILQEKDRNMTMKAILDFFDKTLE